MAKWIPSFEFTNGDIQNYWLCYDIGCNYKLLTILCHVVYATKGFIIEEINRSEIPGQVLSQKTE
jgi:hypothetical protein